MSASEFRTAKTLYDERHADTGLAPKATPDEVIQLASQVTGPSIPISQIQVMRRTICARLSADQFLLYVTRCVRKGVDPFEQAYAFPQQDGGLAMGLKIDGMRDLAMRTGLYVGRKVETLFAPGDTDHQHPIGARCEIRRKGVEEPIVEEAYLSEYDASQWSPTAVIWKRMPETMIRKVAESKALRAAFPDALAGVYEPAELTE